VINSNNDKVEHTISIISDPYDVDVDPYSDKIYVTNLGSNSVSIIDGSTNTILGNVENVTSPVSVDVDPIRSWIYVTNIDTNTLSKIDAVTNKVVKNVTVGTHPYSVKTSGGREYKIYVTNIGSNTVSVIDGISFKLIKNIHVGKFPVGIAVNPKTNKVYVTNHLSNTISVINGSSDTVLKNITVGNNPDGIDINLETNKIYVTNTGSNTVSVIDGLTSTVTRTIAVNSNINPELEAQKHPLPPSVQFPTVASFIAVDQRKNMIYVTNTGSNTVSVIDGSTNDLVIGLTFTIDPPNSGRIECIDKNEKTDINMYDTDKYVRFRYGTELECTSYSQGDYRFNYWSGEAAKISGAPASIHNILDSTLDWFKGLFIYKSDPISINATQYNQGLKANFKAAPDYMAAVVLPIIIGALTLGIHRVSLIYKKRRYKLNQANYMCRHDKIINDAYKASQRSKSEASQRLTQIRNDIIHDYYKGIISECNYEELMNKISDYYQKIGSI
jgi:YVTN family beta-propeller protein